MLSPSFLLKHREPQSSSEKLLQNTGSPVSAECEKALSSLRICYFSAQYPTKVSNLVLALSNCGTGKVRRGRRKITNGVLPFVKRVTGT